MRFRLPNDPFARREALAALAFGVVFLSAFLPAAGYARREHRDGVRRALLREVKTELEQWFNARGSFPLHPSGEIGPCGSTDDPEDWFFAEFLTAERRTDLARRLPRGNSRFPLRYCPTIAGEAHPGNGGTAAGFILEVPLENPRPESSGFNAEHSILERTVRKDDRLVYQICGGTEGACDPPGSIFDR